MSTIAILGGDWQIEMDDEHSAVATTGLKAVRHISGTAIVTSQALYSAVQDAMDELDAMDDQVPMSAATPNAFTMVNGYFIDNVSTQFLKNGAITSSGWTGGEVRRKVYTPSTNFVADDIGRLVTESASSDTGTLLDFEQLPDGTWCAYIRPDDPATDLFDSTSGTIDCVSGGETGTGTGNTVTTVATTGESQWSAIQAIGSVPTATEVYIVQDRIKLTQFWTTDTTVSVGIIEALIRVQLDGTLIGGGILELYGRRYTALYDNFALDVSGGGLSSLPLASSPDINNTTGYARYTTNAETGAGWDSDDVGTVIQNQADATERAVLTSVTGTGPNYTLDMYFVGTLLEFQSGDTLEDIGQTKDMTLNSAKSDTPDGPTVSGAGEGSTVTVAFGGFNTDFDSDSTDEYYSIQVDAQNNVPVAKVYERLKYITRRGAADPFDTPIGIDGEQYQGITLFDFYDNPTGTLAEGDDCTNETEATGVKACVSVHNNTSTAFLAQTYATFADTSGAFANDDVIEDEAAGDVQIDRTAGAGDFTLSGAVTPVKASPFGTFTGSQIFGAYGVLFVNPGAGDAQAYIVTDDSGTLRNPPNTVTILIENALTNDVVFVAEDTGTSGVIDKDRFGGATAQAAEFTTITVGGTIDSETPQAGFVRVVDDSTLTEQRYRYSSRTTTAFTLITHNSAGTLQADAGGDGTTLIDSAGGFTAADIIFGDIIMNITDGSQATVVSEDSDTQLTTTQLAGGTSNDWATGDVYKIGVTDRAYTTSDNVYAPIIDRRAEAGDGGSVSNTLIKTPTANFGVVVNGRQGKIILPFTQNPSVGDSGLTLSLIRTPDGIAT